MEQPTISIIIPVKPGYNVSATQRLAAVDYPADRYEIIIAEGFNPSRQRNMAVKKAQGEIVYFLDDDSLTSPEFLTTAARHYEKSEVTAVGGPSLTPATDSIFQRSIGRALSSLLGGGGMRNRYRAQGAARITNDSELILCNLSFRRDQFLRFGGLDERLYPNEENELLDRMQHSGAALIHDPQLAVQRSQRPTWRLLCRQFMNYGRGRAEQTLISKQLKPASLLPAFFLIYIMVLPFVRHSLLWMPFIAYGLIICLFSASESWKARSGSMFLRLLGIFPLIHICYGLGLWWGLLGSGFKTKQVNVAEVVLKTVKEF